MSAEGFACDAASQHTLATLVELWARDERFRAAVNVAYARGYRNGQTDAEQDAKQTP